MSVSVFWQSFWNVLVHYSLFCELHYRKQIRIWNKGKIKNALFTDEFAAVFAVLFHQHLPMMVLFHRWKSKNGALAHTVRSFLEERANVTLGNTRLTNFDIKKNFFTLFLVADKRKKRKNGWEEKGSRRWASNLRNDG